MELFYSVNDQKIHGVGVVDHASSYRVRIKFRKEMKRVAIADCHSEKVFRDTDRIDYYSDPPLFLSLGLCPIQIEAIGHKGEIHEGLVDARFNLDLTAHINCNGKYYKNFLGAFICQARTGTYQVVWFKEKVEVYHEGDCGIYKNESDKRFVIKSPDGACVYRFVGTISGEEFRYSMYGYNTLRMNNESNWSE
jgi:hypothetical protein